MKNNQLIKTTALTLALGTTLAAGANAQSATRITLNGRPLSTSVSPISQNGRVLVPMRDIFESLGATVSYNNLNQSIAAKRGTTSVRMALGTRNAMVNNVPVRLDVPARTYDGRTFVPLRFVSEAMGADVNFNPATRIVAIQGNGFVARNPVPGGSQVGGYRQIAVPANSVIPVTLDQAITSKNAYVGQTFSATVESEKLGDSEFPAGTHLQGRVTDVQQANGGEPASLGLKFTTAILPDGSRVALNGNLISLDSDSVQQQGTGRVVAKGDGKKNDSLKVIGVGAGAGYVVGRLLKKDGLLSAVIGAAGGYLYDRSRDKKNAGEVNLAQGERLGVRLQNRVVYNDTTGYAARRSNYVKL